MAMNRDCILLLYEQCVYFQRRASLPVCLCLMSEALIGLPAQPMRHRDFESNQSVYWTNVKGHRMLHYVLCSH